MSTRSSQTQLEPSLEEEHAAASPVTGRRAIWNWFGAAFGLTVLVGAGVFYLVVRLSPDSDVVGAVATPTSTVAPATTVAPPAADAPTGAPLGSDQVGATMGPSFSRAEDLVGFHMANSLETHALAEVYVEANTVDAAHTVEMAQLLAALDAVSWPEELSGAATAFRTEVGGLLEQMEAGNIEGVRHGLEAVHAAQHALSVGVYAWLAGATGPQHMDDEPASTPGDETGLRVIEVGMFEFGYTPDTIDIEAGVPVILRFTNSGRLPHEAMVGDVHMQEEFAAAGDHEGEEGGDHHGDLMATLVQPGETRDLEVLIDEPGTWYVACHLVGHYEQGQIATINVRG